MENGNSNPQHPDLSNIGHESTSAQKSTILRIVQEFMNKYGYGMVGMPDKVPKVNEFVEKVVENTDIVINGERIVLQIHNNVNRVLEDDELYNYCVLLCHFYLHILEMHDTAKEGDIRRNVINCKYVLPFFYSHSKLSKYMVECINYVLQTEYFLSPLQKLRVLEGSFVNTRGGKGNCVESDLVQEHSVCNRKDLIKTLGANKTEKSILRTTGSADAISDICAQLDTCLKIKPKSGHHTKASTETDHGIVARALRRIRPFHFTPGRKCKGFSKIKSLPVSEMGAMKGDISRIIGRLIRGQSVVVEEEIDQDPE
jgi:hypothetical protein